MLYVQANYAPVETTIAMEEVNEEPEVEEDKPNVFLSVAQRKAERIAQLLSRREERLRLRLARNTVIVEPNVVLNDNNNSEEESDPESDVEMMRNEIKMISHSALTTSSQSLP